MKTSFAKLCSIACAAIIGLSLIANTINAQELTKADEVIELHIKTLGGRKKLETIKTISSTRTMLVPAGPAGDLEAEIKLFQKGNKFLMVMAIPNVGEIRQGSDGEHYWMSNPVQGDKLMEDNQKSLAKSEYAQPFAPLGWRKDFDGTIELDGTEEVDGVKCYKLVFKPKSGNKATRFFDTELGRLVKFETIQSGPTGDIDIVAIRSDFKKVDGIDVAFTQVTDIPQGEMVMTMDSIEFNVEIDDKEFILPDGIKELVEEAEKKTADEDKDKTDKQ